MRSELMNPGPVEVPHLQLPPSFSGPHQVRRTEAVRRPLPPSPGSRGLALLIFALGGVRMIEY